MHLTIDEKKLKEYLGLKFERPPKEIPQKEIDARSEMCVEIFELNSKCRIYYGVVLVNYDIFIKNLKLGLTKNIEDSLLFVTIADAKKFCEIKFKYVKNI